MNKREQAIAARAKAATPGPWFPGTVLHLALAADVEFAMHAREDIPYLLAQLEDRDTKLEAVAEFISEVDCGADPCEIAGEIDRILKGGV